MHDRRVDEQTPAIGSSRRGALGALAAGLGIIAATRGPLEAGARKKKKRKERCIAMPAGASCSTSSQCCPGTTNRICAQNYCDGYAETVCCGGVDAPCAVHCDCCGDLICGIHGRCVY